MSRTLVWKVRTPPSVLAGFETVHGNSAAPPLRRYRTPILFDAALMSVTAVVTESTFPTSASARPSLRASQV